MGDQDKFPKELTDFLFESSESVITSFPDADVIPVNLSIPYFESVVYLQARIRVLLPYFQISQTFASEVGEAVIARLREEFRTIDSGALMERFESANEVYEQLDEAPFSEDWYHRIFDAFVHRMRGALSSNMLYVWNLQREPAYDCDLSEEEMLELVHRAEIHHVVPFQRLVINFFNYQME